MIKTLLATTGAVLMAVSALPAAPGGHSFAAARGGSPSFSRPAARVSPQYSSARRGYGYRRGGAALGGLAAGALVCDLRSRLADCGQILSTI